jgi:hypothetical protein
MLLPSKIHNQERQPVRDRNAEFVSQQQVREIGRRRKQADSMDFFNLITGPELLETLEALMPEYRERKFPPTVTLAMFLGQILRADSSCRNAVNEAILNQLLQGSEAVSANTGGYCQARERLPTDLVRELARRCASLMSESTGQRGGARCGHGAVQRQRYGRIRQSAAVVIQLCQSV